MNFVSWSQEKGFYYDPDGPYVRRQDYEELLAKYEAEHKAANHWFTEAQAEHNMRVKMEHYPIQPGENIDSRGRY